MVFHASNSRQARIGPCWPWDGLQWCLSDLRWGGLGLKGRTGLDISYPRVRKGQAHSNGFIQLGWVGTCLAYLPKTEIYEFCPILFGPALSIFISSLFFPSGEGACPLPLMVTFLERGLGLSLSTICIPCFIFFHNLYVTEGQIGDRYRSAAIQRHGGKIIAGITSYCTNRFRV